MDARLRHPGTGRELWNTTSYRLARELIVWRERILPGVMTQLGRETGFLLVDRSILSRTLVPRELLSQINPDYVDLYSEDMRPDGLHKKKGRTVTTHDIVPDLIFELIVPKDQLLDRFDDNDPKNEFRRWLVEERYDWYMNASDFIPEEYSDRIIRINGNRPPEEVFTDIIDSINAQFNLNIKQNG